MMREPARSLLAADVRLSAEEEMALVGRMQAGDEGALDTLVRAHYAALCRAALTITRSSEMAEDVVVDVLAAVWQRRAELRVSVSVKSYLYRAVRNRALSAVRDERRQQLAPLDEAAHVADEQGDATRHLTGSDVERVLERAVVALPERCRAVYVLSREDGLSYAEIADVLGISVRTVDAQLRKATARIRQTLEPYLP